MPEFYRKESRDMTLYVSDKDNLKDYSSACVYFREGDVPSLEIPGKVISVDSDSYRIIIKTETTTAVFNANDVTTITFTK